MFSLTKSKDKLCRMKSSKRYQEKINILVQEKDTRRSSRSYFMFRFIIKMLRKCQKK